MPAIQRCLSTLAALLLVASTAHAQASKVPKAGAVWYGDLASARAYMADTAKLYELKHRGVKVEVKAIDVDVTRRRVRDFI